MKNRFFKIIFLILLLIAITIIFLPILKMLLSLSPELLRYIFNDKEIIASIILTFKASFISTLFGILLSIPTAYLIVRYNFWGKKILEAILDIPVMFPHSAAGIALLSIYGSKFFLGRFFAIFGIKFVDTIYGIIIGMFFVSFSYLVNSAKEGIKKIPPQYEYVAMNLGASKFYTFFKIVLPMITSDILTGIIMMWARGISEFGAVVILAYHPMTAPVMIYERFTSFGLNYSKPIAVVMIYVSLIVFSLLRYLQYRFSHNSEMQDK